MMEKAIIAPLDRERPRRRRYLSSRAALLLPLLLACGYTGVFTAFNFRPNVFVKVPINAQQILQQCRNLDTIPSPPLDFHSRTESDRFVTGTKPTLIKNATIWTGNVDGLEIVLGDILLDKGIIQAVGEISAHVLDAYRDVSTIEANGSWVSPG